MARPERKSTRTAQKAKNRRHAAAATEFWYRSHRPMRGSHQKPNEIRTGHCLRRTAANENVKARHRRTMASPKPNNQKKKTTEKQKKNASWRPIRSVVVVVFLLFFGVHGPASSLPLLLSHRWRRTCGQLVPFFLFHFIKKNKQIYLIFPQNKSRPRRKRRKKPKKYRGFPKKKRRKSETLRWKTTATRPECQNKRGKQKTR